MTQQQTFDTVVQHLRKQGCKATGGSGCQYRGQNGTKCAAGCLIPDELYNKQMEGNMVIVATTQVGALLRALGHDPVLVLELMLVHDAYAVSFWETRLQLLAEKFALTYTPPTGATA